MRGMRGGLGTHSTNFLGPLDLTICIMQVIVALPVFSETQ